MRGNECTCPRCGEKANCFYTIPEDESNDYFVDKYTIICTHCDYKDETSLYCGNIVQDWDTTCPYCGRDHFPIDQEKLNEYECTMS
jgi:hypothetical protein